MTVSTTIRYDGPAGLRTRGRILVVPGRGESQATCVRLATRLAAGAYHVRVLARPAIELDARTQCSAHRSVAAAIVGFLERLRGSAAFEPVIRAEYSTW